MSMQNPYKVIAGFTDTGLQEASKNQICLGVKAVFHPNPTIVFVLIKASTLNVTIISANHSLLIIIYL